MVCVRGNAYLWLMLRSIFLFSSAILGLRLSIKRKNKGKERERVEEEKEEEEEEDDDDDDYVEKELRERG
jgi:hypothetical protein